MTTTRPPLLTCADLGRNHWTVNLPNQLPSELITDGAIAELIATFIKTFSFPDNPYAITITYQSLDIKRRAFLIPDTPSLWALYFPKSLKKISNPPQGGFKTGRPIENSYFLNPQTGSIEENTSSLLLLKNRNPNAFETIKRDIETTTALSQKILGVQKPLHQWEWVTRKNNPKIGFVCLLQQTTLRCIQYREDPFSLKKILEIQQQMVDLLLAISQEGYVYRDVKLSNFLLGYDNTTVFIIDFDACFKGPAVREKFLGTARMMAPEYALCRVMNSTTDAVPAKVISMIVNEKMTVFSLGLSFLKMFGKIPAITTQFAELLNSLKGERTKESVQTRSSYTPDLFIEHARLIDPSFSPPSRSLPTPSIIGGRESSSIPLVFLLEKMLAADPRHRFSLKETSDALKNIRKMGDKATASPSCSCAML
jgi:serine/threonine protein kinase